MKHIKLRNTSLELSNICLGAANFGTDLSERETVEILNAYAEAGGNFIDTANVYGKWAKDGLNHSEQLIGKWLKNTNAYNKIIIATKGGHYDLSTPHIPRVNRSDVKKDLEESLKTLGIDCIDFYWLHRDDETKPVEEIIDFMETFVTEGKIRYYGASNYRVNRMKAAKEYSKKNNCQGFSAVSNQWSLAAAASGVKALSDPTLVAMNEEFYQWHKETKMPAIPYSATASGFFEKLARENIQVKNGALVLPDSETGLSKYVNKAYINERNLRIYEDLSKLKNKYNISLYTLSVACLFNQAFNVIPISSVRNVEQLNGFLQASDIVIEENLIEKYCDA